MEQKQVLPGASVSEILEVNMVDLLGNYEFPQEHVEWKWVRESSTFVHKGNKLGTAYEFVLNVANDFYDVPRKLIPTIARAKRFNYSYIVFHQG